MNIFAVDDDPTKAAQALADVHVVKMCLETAQIASTVARSVGLEVRYRSTHEAHPCTRWAGATQANFAWLVAHGRALLAEYTSRYGRTHGSADALEEAAAALDSLPEGPRTPFAQAMPAELKGDDAVSAYRAYYRTKVASWGARARWTRSERPAWLA